MLEGEVFVRESTSVNRLAAGAVPASDVAALEHEVGDHAMESRALVGETGLPRSDLTEVLYKVSVCLFVCGEWLRDEDKYATAMRP